MSTLCCERGETSLMGLLVAVTLFVVVLGSTLTLFDGFNKVNLATQDRTDMQDRARVAVDRVARELRNLSSPTEEQPMAIDAAGPYDIVFQTVDALGPNSGLNAANVMRVRYCLSSTVDNAILYRQTQRWTTAATPTVPSTAACPGTGWTATTVSADRIVNRTGGKNRPMLTYNNLTGNDINEIHVDLFVDLNVLKAPTESRVSTGIFLRNQNRRPVAVFDTPGIVSNGLVLNGSESADPEGEPLTYVWYDGSTKIGQGIVFNYNVAKNTTHSISLKVYDPAGLEGVAAPVSVTA